jgi:hypothetical protein
VSEEEGSQLGSEYKVVFREISVSESPTDLTEAINVAVIESLPASEFTCQVHNMTFQYSSSTVKP